MTYNLLVKVGKYNVNTMNHQKFRSNNLRIKQIWNVIFRRDSKDISFFYCENPGSQNFMKLSTDKKIQSLWRGQLSKKHSMYIFFYYYFRVENYFNVWKKNCSQQNDILSCPGKNIWCVVWTSSSDKKNCFYFFL